MTTAAQNHHWPAEGLTRVPYWIYADPGIYEEEQARIFQGPTWSFLCLEAELPGPNTYRRSNLGAMPVVVTRDKDGALHAFENRCAHRGSLLVLDEAGEARNIICVYHNWSYDLAGNLTGVAFRRGLGGKGGMPAECRPEQHGPRRLRLETIGGLVFGTLADDAPALENYLGREISARIRRVMRAPARLLGGYSQVLHSNWKLYMENVKDTYHASLLHTFFTTFRLNRLSQKGGVIVSDCGGHHVSYALAEEVARQTRSAPSVVVEESVPHTRSAPSPNQTPARRGLVESNSAGSGQARSGLGEGWGGGSPSLREMRPATATPTPSPSPQGGGEHTDRVASDEYSGMRAAQEGFGLEAPILLESVDEFGDGIGLQILSVFPSFVLQQTRNSLAVRRLVPQGVDRTELIWTCFGFADDDDEMTERRLRQANLIGPAGYISMEDGAAPAFVQRATTTAPDLLSVVEMGGASTASDDNRVTEAAVRGFWKAYRAHMGM